MQTQPQETLHASSILTELEAISRNAAEEMKPLLASATVEQYKHFLNMMYYYTKDSEAHLKQAAVDAHTEDLTEYFEHMAMEERGHYILAEKDLEGFGEEVSDHFPSEVSAINAYWDDLKGAHANAYLGMVYVFENIAKYVGEDIKAFLSRLEVTKKQGRWLSVHAEADLEHGEEAKEFAEKYCSEAPEIMLESARKAAKLWLAVNKAPFI